MKQKGGQTGTGGDRVNLSAPATGAYVCTREGDASKVLSRLSKHLCTLWQWKREDSVAKWSLNLSGVGGKQKLRQRGAQEEQGWVGNPVYSKGKRNENHKE